MNRNFEFRVWDKSMVEFIITCNLEPYLHNKNFVIQQYTGLKDSNGNKIFEGDICEDTWQEDQVYGNSPWRNVGNRNMFRVIWQPPSFLFPSYWDDILFIKGFKREVVGHIFSDNA